MNEEGKIVTEVSDERDLTLHCYVLSATT